jgi:hypothetical protein
MRLYYTNSNEAVKMADYLISRGLTVKRDVGTTGDIGLTIIYEPSNESHLQKIIKEYKELS